MHHGSFYGNNFSINMHNNPLTYVLSSTSFDATGHCWVASLANYNFALSYWSGNMNVDCGCSLPHSEGEHNQHIEAGSVCALISLKAQGTTLIEAYSCTIQVTETLDIQNDPKAILVEDWIIAQRKDPVISEIKYLTSKYKLKGCKVYSQGQQIIKQYLEQCSHLVLCKGSYTGK